MADLGSRDSEILASSGEWLVDLSRLRQTSLLRESDFLRFAKNCGLPIRGVVKGDLGDFYSWGWLQGDGEDSAGEALFHPFRLYTTHKVLCSLNDKSEHIENAAVSWNRVVDLAVLLEPLYWSSITGKMTWPGGISEEDYARLLGSYRPKVLSLIRSLDPSEWRMLHEKLRLDAASMDDNPDLYMLLRVSMWPAREKLKGPVAAALWFRHLAEVIRLAFEETHGECWSEEDQGFGVWMKGARSLVYGSERPLSNLSDGFYPVSTDGYKRAENF